MLNSFRHTDHTLQAVELEGVLVVMRDLIITLSNVTNPTLGIVLFILN